MDKIIIKGLKLYAYHGVNKKEKEIGQNFILDVEIFADISRPCVSDNVEDTINYSSVIKSIRRIFLAEKNDLIEFAAQRVADGLLSEYNGINRLKITLKKPDAPIKSDFDWVGIEIERTREDF